MENKYYLLIALIVIIIIYLWISKRSYDKNMDILHMTQLWTQHLFFDKKIAEAYLDNSRSLSGIREQLFQNQRNLSREFAKQYGEQAGQIMDQLLNEHIVGGLKFLDALKRGDTPTQQRTIDAAYKNANEIGRYLDDLKDTNNVFTQHMKKHIDSLFGSAISYMNKDYSSDLKYTNDYINGGVEMTLDVNK
jgi:hypothetical protein